MGRPGESLTPMALLVIHEYAIGQLYETFAEKFPGQRELWSGLAVEEMRHANWMCSLDCAVLDKRRINTKPVLTSLDYVKVLMARAQQGMSPRIALTSAVQIEESIVEKGFFALHDGDDKNFKKVFEKLHRATESHARRLRKALEELAPAHSATPS